MVVHLNAKRMTERSVFTFFLEFSRTPIPEDKGRAVFPLSHHPCTFTLMIIIKSADFFEGFANNIMIVP